MYDIFDEEELKLDKNIEIAKKLEKARHIAGLAYKATKEGQIVEPEPFTITSFKDNLGSVALVANTANKRSNIATYIVLLGYRIVFDSQSPYQFVYFIPHTSDNEHIIGDLEIILEKADSNEKPKTIFHCNTKIMKTPTPSIPHLRKLEHSHVAVKGDKIKVYFTGDKVLSPEKTDLEIRVRRDVFVL